MKILYLIHQFFPEYYTGTERVIYNISSMMQKAGHGVRVITYSFYKDSFFDKSAGNIFYREFTYKGIPVTAIRHKRIPENIHFVLGDKSMASIAEKIILSEQPDIIHIGHPMRVNEFITVSKWFAIPYIITLTDFWLICPKVNLVTSGGNLCVGPEGGTICKNLCPELPNNLIVKRSGVAKDILFDAKRIVSPSRFLATTFKNELPDLDVKIINHGLGYNKLRKKEKHYKKNDKIIFCYAGSLNPHKGVHIIIEAFKKIRRSNIGLKIYGSGDDGYANQLIDLARDDRIEFCGVYSENEAADVFGHIDIVVMASLCYENYPLILHEALASNIPVLASNVGGMAEKIQDNLNGFTFKVGDPRQLKEVMEKIIDDPEILNSLKKNIENISFPNIEQEAFAYYKVYTSVKEGDDKN